MLATKTKAKATTTPASSPKTAATTPWLALGALGLLALSLTSSDTESVDALPEVEDKDPLRHECPSQWARWFQPSSATKAACVVDNHLVAVNALLSRKTVDGIIYDAFLNRVVDEDTNYYWFTLLTRQVDVMGVPGVAICTRDQSGNTRKSTDQVFSFDGPIEKIEAGLGTFTGNRKERWWPIEQLKNGNERNKGVFLNFFTQYFRRFPQTRAYAEHLAAHLQSCLVQKYGGSS